MDLQKCLFCKNDGKPISHFPLPNKPGVVKIEPEIDNGQSESSTKHSLHQHDELIILQDQLKSFFVLQKLLKLEESMFNEYLRINHGAMNPSSWFFLCVSCNTIVDECFSMYKEVVRWSNKFENRKAALENLILQSRDGCGKRRGRKRKNRGNDGIFFHIRSSIENSIKNNPEVPYTSSSDISTTTNHGKRYENLPVAKQCDSEDVASNCKAVNTIQIFEKRSGQSENEKTGKEQQIGMHDEENDDFLGEDILSDSLSLDFLDHYDDDDRDRDEDFTIDTRFLENEDEDDWLPSNLPKKRRKRKRDGTQPIIPEVKATAKRRKKSKVSSPVEIVNSLEDNSNDAPVKKEDEVLQNMDNSKGEESASKVRTTHRSRKTKDGDKLGKANEKLLSKLLHNCNKCPASFSKKEKLDEHDQLMHKDGIGVECPDCGEFLLKNRLKDHKKKHRPKGITCVPDRDKINEARRFRRNFGKYKRIHSVFKNIPYYCDYCPLIFIRPFLLEKHVYTFHKNERSLVPCDLCSKAFDSKQLIKLHCKVDHAKECPEIDKEIFGDDFPVPKQCVYCSLSFPSQLKMDYHIAKFHREHLYKCGLCSYSSHNYDLLRNHQRLRHQPDHEYICEICSRRFKEEQYFNTHRTAEHYKELGLEPFRCEQCGQILGNRKLLDNHVKFVHGSAKEFFCEFCGKGFAWKRTLQQHHLLHTAPKEKQYKQGPFFCEFCDAKFNVRQGLYYHLKNHHSDKYHYRCNKCGMGYFFERTLIAHRKKCVGDNGESITNQS